MSTHTVMLRMSLLLVGHIIFRFSKVGLIQKCLFLRGWGGLNMLSNFYLDFVCYENTFKANRVCCCFLKKQQCLAKLKAKCMIKHVVCYKITLKSINKTSPLKIYTHLKLVNWVGGGGLNM